MEENESEAPKLSPPPKKTKFRGSILKKQLVNNDDSSLDSINNGKSEKNPRRVSFAAQAQIRVFEKDSRRHKSIGGSVPSLGKKDHRKKTGDLKKNANALSSTDMSADDRANSTKHRFSIASNRDAETVSMDSFSHNVKNIVKQLNKKQPSQDNTKDISHPFDLIHNSPVRRSPRLHRTKVEVPIQQPSAEICDLLLQPCDTYTNTSIFPDETTMHVDVSCMLNKLDTSNADKTLLIEKLTTNESQTNSSNLMELSPIVTKTKCIKSLHSNNDDLKRGRPAVTTTVNDDMNDWSMNLSNNVNSSLQTHNLISLDNSTNEHPTTKDPLNLLFNVSSIDTTQQNGPIFYQVDSAESSSTEINPLGNQTNDEDLTLTHKLISILDDDRTQKENANAVYETFLNKSNWFLDRISEINMDYTAKLIHSGSFNESNHWMNKNNNSSGDVLFDDRHQITDHNIVDMDISMDDSSCTQGIEQLATDAKTTFVALNSLLHQNRTLNSQKDSPDSFYLGDNTNNYSILRDTKKYQMSPQTTMTGSQSTTSTTFVIPAILSDDLFENIMETIKIIQTNLEKSNCNLSENFNKNQSKLIQPLHDRNVQADNDNKELAKQITELFTSLSHQKKKMGQLQFDEKFLRSSLDKINMEMDILNVELSRKSLIENIEANLLYSTLNIQYEFINKNTVDHCLNLFNLMKLQFNYDTKQSIIIVTDILLTSFLKIDYPPYVKFLLRLLDLYRYLLVVYFNNPCSIDMFSEKVKNLSFKLYQAYSLLNTLHEYPMQFNFCSQHQSDATVSFKLYYGNFVYSDVTLKFALNNLLECVVESYNVVDVFLLFDCANIHIKPLKQIIDDVLLKPLFPRVNNLFILMEKITVDFHQHVSSKYSQMSTNIDCKDNK